MAPVMVVIPARAGSKGVENKNFRQLNGKPLIEYSIESALEYTDPSLIVVTSDHNQMVDKLSSKYGIVGDKRPKELAGDETATLDVLQYLLRTNLVSVPEKLLLLQPTSPFRRLQHIQESAKLFNDNASSVASVVEVNHHPRSFFTIDGSYLQPYEGVNVEGIRRQDFSKVYVRNGSIYWLRPENIMSGVLMGDSIVPYQMDSEHSINIDTQHDFTIAELIGKKIG